MSDLPPAPPGGGIPDELHILAGEYVLGVLDPPEMQAVRRRAQQDRLLAAAITSWESRLAPLAGVVEVVAPPPPALWSRLERAIAEVPEEPAEAPAPQPRANPLRPRDAVAGERLPPELRARDPEPRLPRPGVTVAPLVPRQRGPAGRPRRVWPWQMATVASLAIAAGIAVIAFLPGAATRLNLRLPGPQFAALVPADGQTPGFLAEARPDGSVVLTALSPMTVPSGHDLELWILRPGATTPASLGVLPAGGRQIMLPGAPPSGTQLMVSLEPPGGSPSGSPTGPVLYKGALAQLSL